MRLLAASAVLAFAATAGATPVRALVERPPDQLHPLIRRSGESPYIYLNRCSGGCRVFGGQANDARGLASDIPPAGQYVVQEFATETGATGPAADAEWNAIVQCVKEVYSPFAVTVTDSEPSAETFTEVLVAGSPSDVAQPADYLGVGTISGNCAPVDDILAFAFANVHPGSGMDRVYQICWTAAQESAHAFGLDHEYEFTDGESACRDPMTYRTDCLGEKFFRNLLADCGEYATRPCRCSSTQNSSAILTDVFGAGMPITAPPVVTITSPTSGQPVPATVHAMASAQRGVATLALFINGSRYAFQFSAVPFGSNGQPASDYAFDVPAAVPPGVWSLVVRAADDVGSATDSDPVVVTNGSPCASDADCLADQTCTGSGACVYPPPMRALGSACAYDQQCTTWLCGHFAGGDMCTAECEVDQGNSCPAPFQCVSTDDDNHGQCQLAASGGCCDVGGSPSSLALALPVVALLRRRLLRP